MPGMFAVSVKIDGSAAKAAEGERKEKKKNARELSFLFNYDVAEHRL